MAADVEAEASVVRCAREPADLCSRLEHRGRDTAFPQLIGCRQTSRPGSDDHGRIWNHLCDSDRGAECGRACDAADGPDHTEGSRLNKWRTRPIEKPIPL